MYAVASGAYHTVAITGCWEQAMPCSGHGACDRTGRCQCFEGFRGYRCADECPGGVGNACSLNGDCIVPKGRAPYCICFEGYSGADCSLGPAPRRSSASSHPLPRFLFLHVCLCTCACARALVHVRLCARPSPPVASTLSPEPQHP